MKCQMAADQVLKRFSRQIRKEDASLPKVELRRIRLTPRLRHQIGVAWIRLRLLRRNEDDGRRWMGELDRQQLCVDRRSRVIYHFRVQANAIITKQTDALKQQVKGAEDTAERQLRAYVGVTSGNYVDAFRKRRWTNFRFIVSGDLSAGPAQLHPSENGNDAT